MPTAPHFVIPGLDPGIREERHVDGRVNPGHDGGGGISA